MSSNLQTVQTIYSAFQRGDVPTILNHLHENVVWEYGTADSGVPWLQKRTHRAQVPDFFSALSALEINKFDLRTLLESGSTVVALIDVAFVVKTTGGQINEEDEVHIWRFDPRGLVVKFCHKVDTYQHRLAYRGQGSD